MNTANTLDVRSSMSTPPHRILQLPFRSDIWGMLRVENAPVLFQNLIASGVWGIGEAIGEIGGAGIVEVERRKLQQAEDGLQQSRKADVAMRDIAGLRPRAGAQQNRAVRVHVVHAAVRIG